MLTRRELLERAVRASAALALAPAGCLERPSGAWVNDVHSRLNRTRVARIERPGSVEALRGVLERARREGRGLCVAAGRHAMGGQQFGSDTVLVDASGLARVRAFDPEAGLVEAEAGIQWPALVDHLLRIQGGAAQARLGIIQKQTGADRLSLGGALAANAHGRVLDRKPMVGDVESFSLMDARGEIHRCSRSRNPELFRLAIGGYGLFGIITSVELRLAARRKLRRVVEVIDVAELPRRFEERIAEGFAFGDFQYSTDLASEDLLRKGVFSCYQPVADDVPLPQGQRTLSRDHWLRLLELAHRDRAEAWRFYSGYYESTSGQIYWSDLHQMSTYVDDYHALLSGALGEQSQGSEMITEVYVPRRELPRFMDDVREDLRLHDVNLIYGTVRLIERDDESFLPWARDRYACVIFNLHTQHDPASLEKTAEDFRRLIDRSLARGGSYFLTYHRWASRQQLLACYPQMPAFLERKRELDPDDLFQSDWYRHTRLLLAEPVDAATRRFLKVAPPRRGG